MMKSEYLFIWCISACMLACTEKHEIELELSVSEISLNAAGTRQKVVVTTGEDFWQVTGCSSWLSVERDSCFLWIEADCNPSKEQREGRIFVAAGGKYARIRVIQDKSVRAVGDPYPNKISPVGIIYKVMDGGVHGKVISLDEFRGKWGREEDIQGVSDGNDGKENTRKIIEMVKDKEYFTSDYSIFKWVYEKNRNTGEEWYIPAFHELNELYHILVGDRYVPMKYIPFEMTTELMVKHDIVIRDRFDLWLESNGGISLHYGDQLWYWSSTVCNKDQVVACMFKDQDTYPPLVRKSEEHFVRAILEF